jgi:hypothetical protein
VPATELPGVKENHSHQITRCKEKHSKQQPGAIVGAIGLRVTVQQWHSGGPVRAVLVCLLHCRSCSLPSASVNVQTPRVVMARFATLVGAVSVSRLRLVTVESPARLASAAMHFVFDLWSSASELRPPPTSSAHPSAA